MQTLYRLHASDAVDGIAEIRCPEVKQTFDARETGPNRERSGWIAGLQPFAIGNTQGNEASGWWNRIRFGVKGHAETSCVQGTGLSMVGWGSSGWI
jgi:hypothetical protein